MTAAFACRCSYLKPDQHVKPEHCIDYLRGRLSDTRVTMQDLDARVSALEAST